MVVVSRRSGERDARGGGSMVIMLVVMVMLVVKRGLREAVGLVVRGGIDRGGEGAITSVVGGEGWCWATTGRELGYRVVMVMVVFVIERGLGKLLTVRRTERRREGGVAVVVVVVVGLHCSSRGRVGSIYGDRATTTKQRGSILKTRRNLGRVRSFLWLSFRRKSAPP